MTYKSKGALAYNLFIFLLKESIAISFFHKQFLFFVCFVFFLFRAIPIAYGSSQARGQIGATLQPQQHGIQAMSVTYAAACGNVGSLTHWARPRIKPASSRILVRFLAHWATTELQKCLFLTEIFSPTSVIPHQTPPRTYVRNYETFFSRMEDIYLLFILTEASYSHCETMDVYES